MPGAWKRLFVAGALTLWVLLATCPTAQTAESSIASSSQLNILSVTNLAQLCGLLSANERVYAGLRLNFVVCASSKPGVVIAKDETGFELLQLGPPAQEFAPGDVVLLEGERCLLRRRTMGTQLSAMPVVDNDGVHRAKTASGRVALAKGRAPLRLDWFNCLSGYNLDVSWQMPGGPSNLLQSGLSRQAPGQGLTRFEPGLHADYYEGFWEKLPDYDLLQVKKSGNVSNFDLGFCARDTLMGIRFSGFLDVPRDGEYTFYTTSDDGSQLFIGDPNVSLKKVGTAPVPPAKAALLGEPMDRLDERRWVAVEGRVSFAHRSGDSIEFEVRSGPETLTAKVADASGLDSTALLNSYVRIVGLGRAAVSASQRLVLDRVYIPSSTGVQPLQRAAEPSTGPFPLVRISQIQALTVTQARRELPVRIRGVVTCFNGSEHWLALQDDTRGVFVHTVTNVFPASAEVWEIEGHTAPGDFAPVVRAARMIRVGPGRMPEPVRPTWSEFSNGSLDSQWVEFQGLVTDVRSNLVSLLLPEGRLEVQMQNYFEPELLGYRQAVVRIRGALFAIWNTRNREVQVGSILMRNATVSIDRPPPTDPFQAPAKTARDLLLFDVQATTFQPFKVRAQVLYAEPQRVFASDDGMGLRLAPAEPATSLQPGDIVEAVGYPDIAGASPVVRQAVLRVVGHSALPEPRQVPAGELLRKGLDSSLVNLEAKLIGLHFEQNSPVLELQSDSHLFLARFHPGTLHLSSPRIGSHIRVRAVYAEAGDPRAQAQHVGSFELLLSSPGDIAVLSQPSWWTLPRLSAVVGLLIMVLALAAMWISQLRRQVEMRTAQLHREIRAREQVERQRALEAERSRIARDLHDDLGSTLTEINALASTGQQANAESGNSPTLFDTIAHKARGSIAALDVIVWAVDPVDNSLQSLADYLSGYAGEYLANSHVSCRFKIPVKFPDIMLEGRVRHDLFLAVKETLNNIVRHSGASEVEFGIAIIDGHLEFVVADNGHGFAPSIAGRGNGLKNLRERLRKLGGNCDIDSKTGCGTTVRIRVPIPASHPVPEQTSNTTFD